jgi:hypothetical protein
VCVNIIFVNFYLYRVNNIIWNVTGMLTVKKKPLIICWYHTTKGRQWNQPAKKKHLTGINKPLRNTFHETWLLRTEMQYSDWCLHNPTTSFTPMFPSFILSFIPCQVVAQLTGVSRRPPIVKARPWSQTIPCRHLWWPKWQWDRFSSEYFGFPLSVSFHQRSILIRSSVTNAVSS